MISEESVAKKLEGLNIRKAPGPCDPNTKLLKLFAKKIAIPIANIFSDSFRNRTFPKVWKRSNVCGIPKVTPCSAVEDLRPISLTSILSKVQESYVTDWLYEDVGTKLNKAQYGGIPAS